MRRSVALSLATMALLPVCGGRIDVTQPPGHAGSDGGFIGSDGGPVLPPGSTCDGYTPPVPTDASQPCLECSSHEACLAAAEQVVPRGYPVTSACIGSCCTGPELPQTTGPSPTISLVVYCNPGTDGDAFCAAYFTQFVLGAGVAKAKCVSYDGVSSCLVDESCPLDADAGAPCSGIGLCVTRAGLTACEEPCQPVN